MVVPAVITIIFLCCFYQIVFGVHRCLYTKKENSRFKECQRNLSACDVQTCGNQLPGCMAHFTNESGEILPVLMECFHNQDNCVRDKCIVHKRMSYTNFIYYCCCVGALCNKNIQIDYQFLKEFTLPPDTVTTTLPPEEKPLSKDKNLLLLILVPCSGFLIVLCVSLYFYKRYEMKSVRRKEPLLPSQDLSMLALETRAIQMLEVVHQGRISQVYKAVYKDDIVAVKILNVTNKQMWATERDMYEARDLQHENILRFFGAEKRSIHNSIQLWIITEYHCNGSLVDYLQENTVDMSELFTILSGIVNGLDYLHEGSATRPAIAHRDLKTRNILVKNDLTCCLGDFGLAIALGNDSDILQGAAQVGTTRYMAPEILQGAITFNLQSYLAIDIYALALVMWEVLSRCHSCPETLSKHQAPYVEYVGVQPYVKDMFTCVVQQERRPFIKEEWRMDKLKCLCETIEDCWDEDPLARLTSSCVRERLMGLLKDPIKWPDERKCSVVDAENMKYVELTESTTLSSHKDYVC